MSRHRGSTLSMNQQVVESPTLETFALLETIPHRAQSPPQEIAPITGDSPLASLGERIG
jgi:hypothetical protein